MKNFLNIVYIYMHVSSHLNILCSLSCIELTFSWSRGFKCWKGWLKVFFCPISLIDDVFWVFLTKRELKEIKADLRKKSTVWKLYQEKDMTWCHSICMYLFLLAIFFIYLYSVIFLLINTKYQINLPVIFIL